MKFFMDVAYNSLNKFGEESCGDSVQLVKTEDGIIIVMADGLGSGVKANILSTLTSKIAVTMLKKGADIAETVDTIVNTLPVCKVRNIAYSTFTILRVYYDGRVYVAEYDNPPFFFISPHRNKKIETLEKNIDGKLIKESNFLLHEGDVIVVVSDGVIHAGVGQILNLGWQWENVMEYLKKGSLDKKCAKDVTVDLIETCRDLYMDKPGDDTTVVALKMRKPEYIDLFSGPPVDSSKDNFVIEKLMQANGKKIICGGTAANIAERELGKKLVVNMDFIDIDVPPTASLEGIDLVTEGVLTLTKAIEKIKKYSSFYCDEDKLSCLRGEDGASKLVRLLVYDCTHLNMWIGKAINPAHQNMNFPSDLSIKLKVIDQLVEEMRKLGKVVRINYV